MKRERSPAGVDKSIAPMCLRVDGGSARASVSDRTGREGYGPGADQRDARGGGSLSPNLVARSLPLAPSWRRVRDPVTNSAVQDFLDLPHELRWRKQERRGELKDGHQGRGVDAVLAQANRGAVIPGHKTKSFLGESLLPPNTGKNPAKRLLTMRCCRNAHNRLTVVPTCVKMDNAEGIRARLTMSTVYRSGARPGRRSMGTFTTKNCPYCAEEIEDEARKCRYCGEWLTCVNCGAEIDVRARFCATCGTPRPSVPRSMPGSEAPSRRLNGSDPAGVSVGMSDLAQRTIGTDTGQSQYAGFWLRVVALFIDTVITVALYVVVFIVIVQCVTLVILTAGFVLPDWSVSWLARAVVILDLAVIWLYFALMWSSRWQATGGKLAVGIVVTDLQGNRIGFGRASGRYFASLLSGLLLGTGRLMMLSSDSRQTLHDRMAGTPGRHKWAVPEMRAQPSFAPQARETIAEM